MKNGWAYLLAGWLVTAAGSLAADEPPPLHQRIDARLAEQAGEAPFARATTDAEFARRLYLDLAGRIPRVDELRAFLADDAPDKRSRLIDHLLASGEFVRRQQELWHVMLMERRGEHPEWLQFLRSAAADNLPWDEFVRRIIKPSDEESQRGAAYFQTQRLVSEGAMSAVDTPGLARDVGRMFAGVDLQCAQCHNDLYVDDYQQRDFQGLLVVFEHVTPRNDLKYPAVAEKLLAAPKEFKSVFDGEAKTTGPRPPGGDEVAVPTFPAGEEYLVPPDRKTKEVGVPRFSPLAELAAGLTAAENRLFARNAANRLWFLMLGRGLVEPLDQIHSGNPPSDPVLLDLLADELVQQRFDVRCFLRELAHTAAYQRASELPSGAAPPAERFAVGVERRLSAEQLFWSVLVATGEFDRWLAAAAANDAANPPADTTTDSPTDTRLERLLRERRDLATLRDLFVKTFANPPQEPEVAFEPTVKGALFLMHDRRLLALLEPQPGNLVDRLASLDEPDAVADELFLAILSRRPTDADRADVADYLEEHGDERIRAVRNLAWALLASTEFCLNH